MGQNPVPEAEVEITENLVRELLTEQHPDLAGLPLLEITGGWDNALFRLGSSFAVRVPRRAAAVPLLENEHRWLPKLAPRLPIRIPVTLRIGRPGGAYPWPWSVRQWIEGETAVSAVPLEDPEVGRSLGAFLRALHVPAPADAPTNRTRAMPLAARTPEMLKYIDAVGDLVDAGKILGTWERAIDVPPWPGPDVWVHGDLHPANVILSHGRLAAVIDFGDLTAGDPAMDLAAAWMLLAPEARTVFRRSAASLLCPIDNDTWSRARGWALAMNLAWLSMSANDAETTAMTRMAIGAVLADE
jgi:aminoglycoside phosphotransferase (APT) family kinase protein